ncbi:MAG: sigma-70 family RNA polymerase sigma factor [Chitinophagaceae bacterium]
MKKNSENDIDLIVSIRGGDHTQFRVLVDKYKDLSFSLACSILKNEHDAEDALQEAFIKVFKRIHTFQFSSSFSTWLYKIVYNTCLTKLQSLNRNHHLASLYNNSSNNIIEYSTPFHEINSKEQKVLVNKILELMHNEESLLLRLFYLAELSILEIKDITGFKESKIKVTLHRARKSFLHILQNEKENQLI